MITRDELKDAYHAARAARERGALMSADEHDAACDVGYDCHRHMCVMGAFLRALNPDDDLPNFPGITEAEEILHREDLPELAARVARIVSLNDNEQFDDALAELKYAIKHC